MISSDIYNHLKNDSVINSLVVGVFPLVAKKDQKLPILRYSLSDNSESDLSGETTIHEYVLEISSIATEYETVGEISKGVTDALEGMIRQTIGTTFVHFIEKQQGSDSDYDPEIDAYIETLSFMIIC